MDVQERYTDLFDRGRAVAAPVRARAWRVPRSRPGHGRPDGAVHRGRLRHRRARAAGLHPAVPRVPRHPRGPRGPRGWPMSPICWPCWRPVCRSARARMPRASPHCCRSPASRCRKPWPACRSRLPPKSATTRWRPGQDLGGGAGQLPPGRAAGPLPIHAERAGQGSRGKPGAAALDRFQA